MQTSETFCSISTPILWWVSHAGGSCLATYFAAVGLPWNFGSALSIPLLCLWISASRGIVPLLPVRCHHVVPGAIAYPRGHGNILLAGKAMINYSKGVRSSLWGRSGRCTKPRYVMPTSRWCYILRLALTLHHWPIHLMACMVPYPWFHT